MARQAERSVAIGIVVALGLCTRLSHPSHDEKARLAGHFAFTKLELPRVPGASAFRTIREVHPSLEHIAGWISTVGAAVALNDLDGDGLPNDVCYVDPRTDQVIVAPVPGSEARFRPFALSPDLPDFDPRISAPMGALPADMNEDGRLDVLVYYWGHTPVAFLRVGPDQPGYSAKLEPSLYMAVDLVDPVERWYTNAATFADIDGDGHFDLVIGNYFPDGANVLDARGGGVESMQHSMSRARNGGKDRILLWDGAIAGPWATVRFTEAKEALEESLAGGWTLAVGAADLDDDLLPELYFASDFGPDVLLHNRSAPGAVRLVPVTGVRGLRAPNSKVLGRDSFKSMGLDFGDVDGDGRFDIYVSNITSEYGLQESQLLFASSGQLVDFAAGVAPFVERSEELGLSRSGWAWEARLADFDNDGTLEALQATGFLKGAVNRWPELQELATGSDELLADPRCWPDFGPGDDLSGHQPNAFFVRADDGRYYDIAADVGLFDPMVSRGIATADVDGDGDLDMAVANQWEPSVLYRNDAPRRGAFLGLHVLLPLTPTAMNEATRVRDGHPAADTPGRAAIGALVRVQLPSGQMLVRQVDGGNGHSGKRSFEVHMGLGDLALGQNVSVEIGWRNAMGDRCREEIELPAGWHTIQLGCGIELASHQ